jgi:hypothetical protein
MIGSFRQILTDPSSGIHLRSVVIDAIRNGPSLPDMREDLKNILVNTTASYHDRVYAVDALLSVIPDGEQEVAEIFRSKLAADLSTARLRADILIKMYGDNFSPTDVISVFKDTLVNTGEHVSGYLLVMVHSLPENALQDIIDNLCDLLSGLEPYEQYRGTPETITAFTRIIFRVLNSSIPYSIYQLWSWLKVLHKFRGGHTRGEKDDLRN